MGSTTHAAARRHAGALIGTVLLATLLAAPKASAAAGSEPAAAPSEAGLLARGAGYDRPRGSARVHALQLRLHDAGETPGPVDGLFGPRTEAAVRHFQVREGLTVDGLVGPHTRTALRRAAALRLGMGYGDGRGSTRVRKLQRRLRSAGEHPGPVDGRFGPLTQDAVQHFQSRAGLAPDGIAGSATNAALVKRLASVHSSPSGKEPRQVDKGKPKASKPAGQPTVSNDVGHGATDTIALALAGGLALFMGIAALLLLWRTREERLLARQRRTGGSEPSGSGRAGEFVAAGGGSGTKPAPVLGYASVDAPPGARFNRELRAQVEQIAAECERRGLTLLELVQEHAHGGGTERPELAYALKRISSGDAEGLVVAELSCLGRSVPELGRTLEWFSRSGARLVVAAQALDTGERGGRQVARTLIDVLVWERERLIGPNRKGEGDASRKGAAWRS
ncbi:MAG: peptidoglycan-binding protein, partial [Thermoleophilaceae bacterium]